MWGQLEDLTGREKVPFHVGSILGHSKLLPMPNAKPSDKETTTKTGGTSQSWG